MNYNDFSKLISSNALAGAYLLHGNEEFVKDALVKSAHSIVDADMRAFNVSSLTEPTLSELSDACETLPFFTDKRLVVCHGLAKDTDNSALVSYLKRMSESTVLLLCITGAVNERSSLLAYFRSIEHEVLFSTLSEQDLIKWCITKATASGAVLDMRTARLFVRLVGSDMMNISNELFKLIDMVGEGGVITPQIISSCSIGNVEIKVFDMIDSFTAGKVLDGMRSLHSLLEDENEALGLAAFLESRVKLMLEARRLLDSGLSPANAVAKMEGSRYANTKACNVAAKYSFEQLSGLVRALADVGYRMMSGGVKASALIETAMVSFQW